MQKIYTSHIKPFIPKFLFTVLNKFREVFHIPFPESRLAHRYLDGLGGIEIGASAHNPFGLNSLNVDYTEENRYKKMEKRFVGKSLSVDMVAPGDDLPFADNSQDFVLSAHVLEHFPDPIKALKEWYRVTKPGGYIFMIIPHKERTFDSHRRRTKLKELIDRYEGRIKNIKSNSDDHYSVWITEDIVELIDWLGWEIVCVQDPDDKVGNGFTIVVQKFGVDNKIQEKTT